MNLVNNITESLKQSVADAAAAAKAAGKINFEELPQFVLEVPKDKAHGDFASNIALVLAKQAKMRPRDIATAIAEEISDSTLVAKVEIAVNDLDIFFRLTTLL
jgi:arginyl-tRNA synthetase